MLKQPGMEPMRGEFDRFPVKSDGRKVDFGVSPYLSIKSR